MAESYGMNVTELPTDSLFSGGGVFPEIPVEVLSGEGELVRGTVLGKVTKGAISIAESEENTGDGEAGEVAIGPKAVVGDYTLVCITEATNAGTFAVYDPNGYRLADLTVAAEYDNGHFSVTIADGAEDFDVGDVFTVTVAAGSRKYRAYDDDNTDGSDVACAVLGRDIDATELNVKAFAYAGGEFNESALTGIDTAGVDDLAERGIIVK